MGTIAASRRENPQMIVAGGAISFTVTGDAVSYEERRTEKKKRDFTARKRKIDGDSARMASSDSGFKASRSRLHPSLPKGQIHSKTKRFTFAAFSDGQYNGFSASINMEALICDLRRCGSKVVAELITAANTEGHPFTHVVYTTHFPWIGHTSWGLTENYFGYPLLAATNTIKVVGCHGW
ncbi:unnamed protein product [Ilex paraguariensis]|uniref:Uncharacterized protein n=1 Tax=Ilex paraguariensis TaxID=185542 RepID=A0ABC8RX08_9AQUA